MEYHRGLSWDLSSLLFITDLEEATVTLIEDTKLRGCVEVLESRAATQGDLEEQADRNLVKLNTDKYKVLHLTKSSSMQQHQLLFRSWLLHHTWSGCRDQQCLGHASLVPVTASLINTPTVDISPLLINRIRT